MRRVIILSVVVLLLGAMAVPALADSDNWDHEKQAQVLVNRCANAGAGNGGELGVYVFNFWHHDYYLKKACVDKFFGHDISIGEGFEKNLFWGLFKLVDLDPGNSGQNNNAPDAPPGQDN